MSTKATTWESDWYDILSVVPAANLLAVFAYEIESGEDAGMYELVAEPIRFLAVCKVTTKHCRGVKGEIGKVKIDYEESRNEVCGLQLYEGGVFEVVNEASNFAGLMYEGDDINQCTGHLEYNITKKLKRRPKQPEP